MKTKQYNQDYYKQNTEKIVDNNKKYYENHKGEVRVYKNEHHKSQKEKNPIKHLLTGAKSRASRDGIEFNIKIDDIEIPKFCPILGIPLFFTYGLRTENTPSIDRIDNTLGYIEGNVQIISWRANHIKSSTSFYELEKIIRYYQKLLTLHQEETNILEINNA